MSAEAERRSRVEYKLLPVLYTDSAQDSEGLAAINSKIYK
jgi:hypothetical protein